LAICRGLIEAMQRAIRSNPIAMFSAAICRGLIEAQPSK
jgi:hypothetical protein